MSPVACKEVVDSSVVDFIGAKCPSQFFQKTHWSMSAGGFGRGVLFQLQRPLPGFGKESPKVLPW